MVKRNPLDDLTAEVGRAIYPTDITGPLADIAAIARKSSFIGERAKLAHSMWELHGACLRLHVGAMDGEELTLPSAESLLKCRDELQSIYSAIRQSATIMPTAVSDIRPDQGAIVAGRLTETLVTDTLRAVAYLRKAAQDRLIESAAAVTTTKPQTEKVST